MPNIDDQEAFVLLLSLEHAASGSNLTAANHVIFVHPMNADTLSSAVAYERQALARVRRVGQERAEVHVWRFVTRETVEEHMHQSLDLSIEVHSQYVTYTWNVNEYHGINVRTSMWIPVFCLYMESVWSQFVHVCTVNIRLPARNHLGIEIVLVNVLCGSLETISHA